MAKLKPKFHFDIVQGTDEWKKIRAGRITASDYAAIMAKGKGRENVIYRVASELITGAPIEEGYINKYMLRGKEQEAEARAKFSMVTGLEVKTVGFVSYGVTGSSPDGLIDGGRGLEIKSMRSDLLARVIDTRDDMSEHKAQLQGNLMCTDYDLFFLAVYCPDMPMYRLMIPRDEAYIRRLRPEVTAAHEQALELAERIKRYKA